MVCRAASREDMLWGCCGSKTASRRHWTQEVGDGGRGRSKTTSQRCWTQEEVGWVVEIDHDPLGVVGRDKEGRDGGVGRTALLDMTGKAGVVVMGRMYPLGVVRREREDGSGGGRLTREGGDGGGGGSVTINSLGIGGRERGGDVGGEGL